MKPAHWIRPDTPPEIVRAAEERAESLLRAHFAKAMREQELTRLRGFDLPPELGAWWRPATADLHATRHPEYLEKT